MNISRRGFLYLLTGSVPWFLAGCNDAPRGGPALADRRQEDSDTLYDIPRSTTPTPPPRLDVINKPIFAPAVKLPDNALDSLTVFASLPGQSVYQNTKITYPMVFDPQVPNFISQVGSLSQEKINGRRSKGLIYYINNVLVPVPCSSYTKLNKYDMITWILVKL